MPYWDPDQQRWMPGQIPETLPPRMAPGPLPQQPQMMQPDRYMTRPYLPAQREGRGDRPYVEITPNEPAAPPEAPTLTDPLASAPKQQQGMGLLGAFLEPFTSMPEEYSRRVHEGIESIGKGYEKVVTGKPKGSALESGVERGAGIFQMLGGLAEYVTAPIETPIHTIAGRPIERATAGMIPAEYTDLALGLAIPGYGFTKPAQIFGKAKEGAQAIFAPETLSPAGGRAAAEIRSAQGTATRDFEVANDAMEKYRGVVNQLPDADRLNLMNFMEGRPVTIPPALQEVADTMREAFKIRREKLERLFPDMSFVDDYFPHMWKDPRKAQSFVDEWRSGSRQGSGASLKKRSIPTIEDGIRYGLEPISTDPIELTLRYTQSMDKFIAQQEIFRAGLEAGDIKYFRPKTVGASGHPEAFPASGSVPEGWIPIKYGRGAQRADGAQAYAPQHWAMVYNNFFSPGWNASPEYGNILNRAQMASNSITALELGLSGYHALTMAQEGIISEFARGFSQLLTPGQRFRGVGSVALSPLAPVKLAYTGRKARDVYLGRNPGTPDFRKTMDLLEQAGGRGTAGRHAPEYEFSAMDNFWTAFKRGALQPDQYNKSVRSVLTGQANIRGGLREVGKEADIKKPFQLVGQTMSTVAYPLFKKYIPLIKDGAFHEQMSSWLRANPGATQAEQMAMARRTWDSIDNRFGEMVQDNIFWNKTLKQVSTLAMRSYSWNMGTIREIGGGTVSALRGKGSLKLTDPAYDPRVAYLVGFAVVPAVISATYQKLMTGKDPQDARDLVQPLTGGTAPGFGGRGKVDERLMWPGYWKDVFGWFHDWEQEAVNKVARGPAMTYELFRNKDWRGDPIADENAAFSTRLSQYLGHVGQSLTPISVKAMLEGRKTGSALGPVSQMLGVRPGSAYIQDPEGYKRGMKGVHQRAWKSKERHERNLKRQYKQPVGGMVLPEYGGPEE